ncbi:uncharacterized protein LOC144360541 [Saccoglossus kowalevskii]
MKSNIKNRTASVSSTRILILLIMILIPVISTHKDDGAQDRSGDSRDDCHGVPGIPGIPGTNGLQGPRGDRGETGRTGDNGSEELQVRLERKGTQVCQELSAGKQNDTPIFGVCFMRNQNELSCATDDRLGRGTGSVSNSIILELLEGDEIWVRQVAIHNPLIIYRYNTFSGYMIFTGMA